MNLSLYKEKIKKYDVISFDMYDTLVHRNVDNPNDIFSIVEYLYNKQTAKQSEKIEGFSAKRIYAYQSAYKKRKASCNIDDIYEFLTDYSNNTKEILKTIEIDIEKKICVADSQVLDLFNYAKKIGKRVIIISDMYLHTNVVKYILKSCGVLDYDKLYVSCSYRKSKTDGKLYDVCCRELNVKPGQILHFGDGLKNDIIRAAQKGIGTIRIKNSAKLDYNNNYALNKEETFAYKIQQSFIKNHMELVEGEVTKLGFSVFGPLVVGFCTWLHDEVHSKQMDKVLFLAREGLLFKTIYELLYPDDNIIKKYFYISRKSLVEPTYWIVPEYENIIKSIAKSKEINIKALIQRWGLEPEQYIDVIENTGLSLQTVLDGQHLIDDLRTKKLYEQLKNDIIQQSKSKYKLLEKYLIQEDFGGKCAIVDIGWNGGMQNAFEKIASIWNEATEIHGYYIGINTNNLGVPLHNINGFVYDEKHHADNRYLIYSFAGPLELSLTAIHDTTIGYQTIEDKIIPVFGSGEYINEDGSLQPELLYTAKIQKGIIQYTKAWMSEGLNNFADIMSETSFNNCRLFGLKPMKKHIMLFYKFRANDLGIEQHFVNPKYKNLFGKNNIIKGFWTSTWKSGYMKMIFKLPLPYHKIYIYMRKKVN